MFNLPLSYLSDKTFRLCYCNMLVRKFIFFKSTLIQHPEADSLFVETVDLGEECGPRTVISGLNGLVSMEKLDQSLGLFLCNLKPVKMRGIESQAMLMCASL